MKDFLGYPSELPERFIKKHCACDKFCISGKVYSFCRAYSAGFYLLQRKKSLKAAGCNWGSIDAIRASL